MSNSNSHPALHEGITHSPGEHFIPNGWEVGGSIGACPCGELVEWGPAPEAFVVDRSLRMLVLTAREAELIRERFLPEHLGGSTNSDHLRATIDRQLSIQEEA